MSKVRKRDGDSSPNTGAFMNEAAYRSYYMDSFRVGDGHQSLGMAMNPLSNIYANTMCSFSLNVLRSSPSNPRNIRSREGYSSRNMGKVTKKEGDNSPRMGTLLKSEGGGYSSPNMSKNRSQQRYTSPSQRKVGSWDGHSSPNMGKSSSSRHSRANMGMLRSGTEYSSPIKRKISSREEYSSPMIRSHEEGNNSQNSESSRNKAPEVASGSNVRGPDRAPTLRFSLNNAGRPGSVSRFVEAATVQQLHVLGFPDIMLLTTILLTITCTADGINNGTLRAIFYLVVVGFFIVWLKWVLIETRYQGTILARNKSKPLLHIIAALVMIQGFLRMILLNGSHSLSLSIFLMVTVSFVCIIGYEALKEPDNVPKHGRDDNRSFVEKLTTTDKANFKKTYDVTSHQKELNGPMILSAALTALIDILISGDFKNYQTATSEKGKNSLQIAAISFCFLSYIIGVISVLINSVPPKVHSEAHLEKVENASGILYFVFIFLVIVTVVTITACHLSGYALFNVMPLIAELGRPPNTEVNLMMSSVFKPMYFIIVAVLLQVMAAIIQGQSTNFYRDMSKLYVSMGLVSYLSEKLATFAQPKPARSQQKVEHLD